VQHVPVDRWGVSAIAQTNDSSASLKGVVSDPEGKAVVNATVLIRNEASPASADPRTTMTDATGRFAVSGLLPGAYTIEVAVPGFDLVERNGVVVSATGGEEIAIRLTVANISETVTVSAALPEALRAGDFVDCPRTEDEWVAAVTRAVERGGSAAERQRQAQRVRGEGWPAVASRIGDIFAQHLNGHAARPR